MRWKKNSAKLWDPVKPRTGSQDIEPLRAKLRDDPGGLIDLVVERARDLVSKKSVADSMPQKTCYVEIDGSGTPIFANSRGNQITLNNLLIATILRLLLDRV